MKEQEGGDLDAHIARERIGMTGERLSWRDVRFDEKSVTGDVQVASEIEPTPARECDLRTPR